MNILVISDLHAPYHHPAAIDFLAGLRSRFRPDNVVCIGDEIDAHAWSSHDHNPDLLSGGSELDAAVAALRPLYKLFPTVKVLRSNHGERAARLAVRHGLPSRFLRAYREVIDAPAGWTWHSWVRLGGIHFEHGEGYSGINPALRAAASQGRNTVIGHVHSTASVQYASNGVETIWGASTGCLINPDSLAFNYARKGPRRPILSTLMVLDGVPHVVPLGGA